MRLFPAMRSFWNDDKITNIWSGLTIVVLGDWTFLRGAVTLVQAACLGFACLGFGGCRASLIPCSIKWNSSSELTSIIYKLLAFTSLHQLNFSFTKLLNVYYLPTRFYPRQNILWNALVELIDIIDVFAHSCQQRLYCIGADKPNGNRHFVQKDGLRKE